MTNIKKYEEKVKKGVDKWGMAWYSNQAVADEAGARVWKDGFLKKFKKALDKPEKMW